MASDSGKDDSVDALAILERRLADSHAALRPTIATYYRSVSPAIVAT